MPPRDYVSCVSVHVCLLSAGLPPGCSSSFARLTPCRPNKVQRFFHVTRTSLCWYLPEDCDILCMCVSVSLCRSDFWIASFKHTDSHSSVSASVCLSNEEWIQNPDEHFKIFRLEMPSLTHAPGSRIVLSWQVKSYYLKYPAK